MQQLKVNGQSIPNLEWKQTDEQTEATALPHSLMRSVINANWAKFIAVAMETVSAASEERAGRLLLLVLVFR